MQSTGRLTRRLRRLVHYKHDICSSCGEKLPEGTPAFAGYDKDSREVYVGKCCQKLIFELGSHIYWWWTTYRRPERTEVMWRYMDFAKFVTMLKDRGLWLSRADKLGDRFEGARGYRNREDQWKDYCLEYFRHSIRTVPGQTEEGLKNIEADAARLYEDFRLVAKRDIERSYVTCWHANEGESEALWRLYCPPPSPGIAIFTTFELLDTALGEDNEVNFGHVQYIDYRRAFSPTYDRVFAKRSTLSHEQEVRGVVTTDEKKDEAGFVIKVDLAHLIGKVVISPFAPAWFEGTVKDALAKYGVTTLVTPSELSEDPFFA